MVLEKSLTCAKLSEVRNQEHVATLPDMAVKSGSWRYVVG